MQKHIEYYYLIYTPKGPGRVEFRLEGENSNRSTSQLTAEEFSALALVLAQKNLTYDIQSQTFSSRDTDSPGD